MTGIASGDASRALSPSMLWPIDYIPPSHHRPVPKETVSADLRRIGARIRQLRQERDLSQVALARASGVDRAYLSGIERGSRNFTMLHLFKISRALRVSASEVLEDR